MDSFDADCLIYATLLEHPAGKALAAMFNSAAPTVGLGSTMLIPEVLAKPLREHRQAELRQLQYYLGRLDLYPLDQATAQLAALLCARHRLKAADAVHLATAVHLGADRFITNNRRDFRQVDITEVDITYPEDL